MPSCWVRLFCAASLLLLPLMSGRAGEAFLTELEDLPLAPGLTEVPGGLLFDSADGRIVEAQATGAVTAPQVRQFYTQTLAELGWSVVGDLQFRRDTESLKITFDMKKQPMTVHFSLTPTH